MAPFSNIEKNNSFGIPDGYFDSVTNQIQTKISEDNLIETYGNKNPFSVPEGYFQNFTVEKDESNKGKIIRMLKPWISIAAGILVVFGIWQIVLTAMENNASSIVLTDTLDQIEDMQYAEIFDFSEVDDNIIENAVSDFIAEYDDNTLSSLADDKYTSSEISEETLAVYDYYIDYSDDYSDYEELLAEL